MASGQFNGQLHFLSFDVSGEAVVLWMKEKSHISVGKIQVNKGLRISLVDGTSLLIKSANRDYAGTVQINSS